MMTIISCVTIRVQEYGKGVKKRKSSKRNNLNSVEFFDGFFIDQSKSTDFRYEQAAEVFEQVVDRLQLEQRQGCSSRVSSQTLDHSLLVMSDASTEQGEGFLLGENSDSTRSFPLHFN